MIKKRVNVLNQEEVATYLWQLFNLSLSYRIFLSIRKTSKAILVCTTVDPFSLLSHYGTRGLSNNCFASYLTHRK